MNLSANFSLQEMIASDYAIRHGITNSPTDAETMENLHLLARGLERVRAVIGKPIIVNSGYRSPKVNSAVGGSKTSYHVKGLAADIRVPGMTAKDVCLAIVEAKEKIQFRTVIWEGTWTHIDFPDTDEIAGGNILTAIFKNGGVSYVTGVA